MPSVKRTPLLKSKRPVQSGRLWAVGGVAAVVGLGLLVIVWASGSFGVAQAIDGMLAGGAVVVKSAGASDGKAVMFGGGSAPPTQASTPAPSTTPAAGPIHWMMAMSAARNVQSSGVVGANFIQSINNANTYEVDDLSSGAADPLPAATHVMSFKSYQAIQSAFAQDQVPASVSVILYDNEDWAGTPAAEQVQPFTYVALAEQAVHAQGKAFMNAPGADLKAVLDPSASNNYAGYLQTQLATLAKYSDIFEIQAQNESSVAAYKMFADQAIAQARAANPKAQVLLGLTAKPGGPSVQGLISEYDATKQVASGYWLNIPGGDAGTVLPLKSMLIRH